MGKRMSHRGQKHLLAHLNSTAATLTITACMTFVSSAAWAQSTDGVLEEIISTGSRISGSANAPTPTTVIGADYAEMRASANIATMLNEMPAFKASNSPATSSTSSANGGSNFLNLRGLGPQRTLVLVDGRRHVATTSAGLVDLNAIPINLLSRVEVVTGGASAAYGSDAVAGVVNLILDDSLDGVKGDLQYGQSQHSDSREYRGSIAYGTKFGNDRGHLLIGGEFVDNKGLLDQKQRKWGREGWQVISNPKYTPTNGEYRRLISPNVHPVNATEGGIITSGVNAGKHFLPGGVVAPFQFGDPRGSAYMVGGDGIHMGQYVGLAVPVKRYNTMGRVDYDLTDNVRVFAEASFSRSQSINNIVQPYDFGTLTIKRDNAFLPTSLYDSMLTAGETSFKMGRISTDHGFYTTDFDTKTKRGVLGFEGDLGGWTWNAYYQEGRTDYSAVLRNRVNSRYANSIDSVIDPVTKNPICRINLNVDPSKRDPACVPVNLFGFNSPSQAAIDYFMADQWQKTKISQRVAEFSISGSPFETWAGAVDMALGADYRREKVDTTVDEMSIASAYSIGNPKPIKGSYNVKEVFGEVSVPVLRDLAFAEKVDINGAVRYTDYSTSGTVTTWKFGGSWTINDSLRLRATRSRDIRAPNIDEMFMAGQLRFATVIDPANGAQTNVSTLAGGNINLTPEKADTFTAGFVVEPSFVPRLRASVDYYNIKLKDAISTLGPQDIVTRCAGGTTMLCDRIIRDGSGAIGQVILTQMNLSTLKTSGVDAELQYTLPLSGSDGTLQFRVLASYVKELSTNDGVMTIDRAGDLGNGLAGVPHWRGNASVTYSQDRFALFTQARYIGSGKYDSTFTGMDINDNTIPSRLYVDLSGHYEVMNEGASKVQLFFNINNLFNKNPPVNPSTFFASLASAPELYDMIGRYFSGGVRFKF
ncbi:TonB-dependent receptor [Govanella unica]|uniref:TonB-dependent receptor n=1 Tax=Govanella unica TaxID=2975056 RepID=A0A9X3U0J0_9PROT|nr:TonB-dependent receptor [Govania unica]MDA5195134.1 TonB-dependent receptor [Govania unica]